MFYKIKEANRINTFDKLVESLKVKDFRRSFLYSFTNIFKRYFLFVHIISSLIPKIGRNNPNTSSKNVQCRNFEIILPNNIEIM